MLPRLRTSPFSFTNAGLAFLVFLSCLGQVVAAPPSATSPDDPAVRQAVSAASQHGATWSGPRQGPPGKAGANVAILSEDLRNGGILGVAQGVREAARVIGWKVRVFDAGGTSGGRDKAASDAVNAKPDALILIGGDANEMKTRLTPFHKRGIPVVGWHVGPQAGPVAGSQIAVNVSTDPLQVARITAMAAIADGTPAPGIVVLTDSNYEIAMAKARAMEAVVRGCRTCTVLAVRDVAIARANEEMPAVTRELLSTYGKRWTHTLAINDIYFDYAVPELVKQRVGNKAVRLLSAGDGSASAFMRIQAGSFQTATVAEPLNLHGWQLVDETNRLLNGQPVSGYIVPVRLVTPENIAFDGGQRLLYDPENQYRDIYRQIWQR